MRKAKQAATRQSTLAELELRDQGGAPDEVLREISSFLDGLPQVFDLVHEDLTRGLKRPSAGRGGLGAEQTLRSLILQRIKNWDYRELRERIANGYDLRVFAGFFMDRVTGHDTFHRAISRITPAKLGQINDIVVKAAVDFHIDSGRKLRIDTTVVETDIHYPTDGSLLSDTVRTLTRLMFRIKELLPSGCIAIHDRTRHAKRRNYELNRIRQRTGADSKRKYRDLIQVTEEVITMARDVVKCSKTLGGRSVADAVAAEAISREIEHFCGLGERVVNQARRGVLLEESVPAREKIFSIFEDHTDIIVRGKARKPNEFGHKVLLSETATGLITNYSVLEGNPRDERFVPDLLEKHRSIFGAPPQVLAADRGFHSEDNMRLCKQVGVNLVSIPKRGGSRTPEEEAYERSRSFKRAQRFRSGIEGRISVLLRGRGMRRCRLHGEKRFEFFVASAVLANNLLRIADHLMAKRVEPQSDERVA